MSDPTDGHLFVGKDRGKCEQCGRPWGIHVADPPPSLFSQNAALRARVEELERELSCAASSLLSYELSCGVGNGIEEAFDIAKLLGYDGDRNEKDLEEWLNH